MRTTRIKIKTKKIRKMSESIMTMVFITKEKPMEMSEMATEYFLTKIQTKFTSETGLTTNIKAKEY